MVRGEVQQLGSHSEESDSDLESLDQLVQGPRASCQQGVESLMKFGKIALFFRFFLNNIDYRKDNCIAIVNRKK